MELLKVPVASASFQGGTPSRHAIARISHPSPELLAGPLHPPASLLLLLPASVIAVLLLHRAAPSRRCIPCFERQSTMGHARVDQSPRSSNASSRSSLVDHDHA